MDVIDGIAEEFITGDDTRIKCTKMLSSGGYGKVYEMKVVRTGKRFARKTIHLSGPITKQDIENEAITIEKLRKYKRHRNIVTIFRHGWLVSHARGNVPLPVYFIDMELGDQNLDQYIKGRYSRANGKLSLLEIWVIMLDIAAGLDHLHRRAIIHRDLKPANVIMGTSYYSGYYLQQYWMLADFGISTAGTAKRLIATNDARGTARYRAPEILFSEPSVPSYSNKVDIWALGLILYELLTGTKAFETDYHIMQYGRDGKCPQLPVPSTRRDLDQVPSQNGSTNSMKRLRLLQTTARSILAVEFVPAIKINESHPTRSAIINQQLAWILQKEPDRRPPIKDVGLLLAANLMGAIFEQNMEIGRIHDFYGDIIEAPFIVRPSDVTADQSLHISRLQFYLKSRAAGIMCSPDIFAYFVRGFLSTDIDDINHNRELLEFFDQRLDLCVEFKHLYVEGRIFDSSYTKPIDRSTLNQYWAPDRVETEVEITGIVDPNFGG